MEKLQEFISKNITNSEQQREIIGCFEEVRLNSGNTLVTQGQTVSDYFFISKGAVRFFSENDGYNYTCWFAMEGEFFTELASLRQKHPTKYSIEAIEESSIFKISSEKMEELYQKIPEWQAFGRRLWESAFLRIEQRLLSFQTEKAENRYLKHLKSGLLQRVTLKDFSSYIGITPNSLSRIRKNIR